MRLVFLQGRQDAQVGPGGGVVCRGRMRDGGGVHLSLPLVAAGAPFPDAALQGARQSLAVLVVDDLFWRLRKEPHHLPAARHGQALCVVGAQVVAVRVCLCD